MSRQTIHEANLLDYYRRVPHDLGCVRSAYGDAAGICDAIARDIEAEYTKRGRLLKDGEAFAAIAKRCADAVWAMRDKVSQATDDGAENA